MGRNEAVVAKWNRQFEENKYIKEASLNGEDLFNLNLTHTQIIDGGELELKMYNRKASNTPKNTLINKKNE
ncbi:glycoside hydrolase domain-containing protein [Poritiphilus flavus]|uniref:Glycosyl hydrolase family 92 domain-containing protein n=1 Tax=Poritiphilus flavus TaxID=2697053 RepID=A0A6L9EC15_9FLAO|nr:glycoside hydrolase domain-containing protein [Poritiphilus flavus]NAS12294.1 hypothetical protein [Poritiphilus flavus]